MKSSETFFFLFLKKCGRFTSLRVILAQGYATLLCVAPVLVFTLPNWAQTSLSLTVLLM